MPLSDETSYSPNLMAQAEKLYESHLRARLHRLIRTVKQAKVEMLRDPLDPGRKTYLHQLEKEMEELQVQVIMQSSRADEASRAAQRAQAAQLEETPVISQKPSDVFRDAQATKAEQASDVPQSQLIAQKLHTVDATDIFNAMQADKAREIVQKNETQPTCPGCGASVASGTARCECGYVLVAAADSDNDFISAEELAALRAVPGTR